MATRDANPIILIQNRQDPLLKNPQERLRLYRRILQTRFDRLEKDNVKIPNLRGLGLRLPNKPFHATPEIFFQEGGQTRFDFPNQSVTAVPGDVTVVPARMPHGEYWSGSRFLVVVVMFQFEGTSLHFGFLENEKPPIHIGPIDRFQSINQLTLIRYADEIASISGTDAISRRLRKALYLAFLARLIQGLGPSKPAPPPKNDWILRCKELIETYFGKLDFSVAWLAQQMACSPDHVSRRFRNYTGYRIMEMVHRLRIDQAQKYLRGSNMNIAEIAWTCGYSQPSYFNRIFKSLLNTTPKEYRNNLLEHIVQKPLDPDRR
jgi:AraC-like DNA-binding protein